MLLDFEIPSVLPVMTLRDTVFFPQSILPLYIFEKRYRRMLESVLSRHRMFAVACQNEPCDREDAEELPCGMATVGVIRASHENADGTSNLVLQGVCRVEVLSFSNQDPFPTIEVKPHPTVAVPENPQLMDLRTQIKRLLHAEDALTNGVPPEFLDFLCDLDDLEAFIDLTAYATCRCTRTKQRLLETLNLGERYRTFLRYLTVQHERIHLQRQLQGEVDEDDIQLN